MKTKVVYNNCYGGFHLSYEAEELLKKLNPELAAKMEDWQYDIPRHHPDLVKAVEQTNASAEFSDIAITEIEGDRYIIREYDGLETVVTPKDITWIMIEQPTRLTSLPENHIFVFGSNRLGIHRRGAAADAVDYFGAVYGVGEGLQGQSYALPTKADPKNSLTLPEIQEHIGNFIYEAFIHPEHEFHLTEVGCGLAGYAVNDIAPLFYKVLDWFSSAGLEVRNIIFPEAFKEWYVEDHSKPIIDPIVEEVIDGYRARSKKGLVTYGTTLAANNTDDFLQHLQEELMDAVLYIQKLKHDSSKDNDLRSAA